jgi:hypothetical protein
MPRVLALYSMIYVTFKSNKQPLKNKRHSLLVIGKFKKNPIKWQNINL